MIETLIRGDGAPVTLFAHGFAGSITETRPFGSGVDGTRVFFHFRGHGETPAPDDTLTYAALGDDVLQVRAETHATRGLGVSLGAGALLAAAVRRPDAFERLVLVIPAAVDRPRAANTLARVEAMAVCADAADIDGLTTLLLDEQPADVRERRVVQAWARHQATVMCGEPLHSWMRRVPRLHPVDDLAQLAVVGCPVLVLGQEDDEAHPADLVDTLVDALPDARGEILSPGGVLWTHRGEVRALVSGFLNS